MLLPLNEARCPTHSNCTSQLLSALAITVQLLREGGTFVAKIFRGRGSPLLYAQLKSLFADVYVAKPKSSRGSSVEAFIVGRGFKLPSGFRRGVLTRITTESYGAALGDGASSELERLVVPFVACGDLSGFDEEGGDLDGGG